MEWLDGHQGGMGIRERKQREFQRREQEILDAALALFATADWRSVTVEQIAERAEIGKGTVYKHFVSKEEIYARLALDFHRHSLEELRRLGSELPVVQRLRRMIEVVWAEHMRSEAHHRLVQFCEAADFRQGLTAETQAELAAMDAAFQAEIDSVLQRGINDGVLPRKPLPALLLGPMAALKGAVRLAWSGQLPPEERPGSRVEEITNFILAGMLYQEWLAEEGLDPEQARRRAEAEQVAAETDAL
jgi:AcrR family transcriptional regulator